MADMSTLEVEADVSDGNLSKAQVGQPVEIVLDALPGVRFKGSFLSQDISAADQQTVLAVPAHAIVTDQGKSHVYRLATVNGKEVAQSVPVTLGRQLGDLREISGELKSGDKLEGTPPAGLSDGARVRLATS